MKIKVSSVTKISLGDWLDQEDRTLFMLKLRDEKWLACAGKGDNAPWVDDSWMGTSALDAVRKMVSGLNAFKIVDYSIYLSAADVRKIERSLK